jgi:hypothetical protein
VHGGLTFHGIEFFLADGFFAAHRAEVLEFGERFVEAALTVVR